jgi:hypothetical protein
MVIVFQNIGWAQCFVLPRALRPSNHLHQPFYTARMQHQAYRRTETVIKSANAMHMKKDDHPSEHYWSLQTENAAKAPEPI